MEPVAATSAPSGWRSVRNTTGGSVIITSSVAVRAAVDRSDPDRHRASVTQQQGAAYVAGQGHQRLHIVGHGAAQRIHDDGAADHHQLVGVAGQQQVLVAVTVDIADGAAGIPAAAGNLAPTMRGS